MPILFPAIKAALGAGAKGAFLSGAGSSVMALTQNSSPEELQAIADAMQAAADELLISGRTIVSKPSSVGAQVVVTAPGPRQYISTRDVSRAPKSFEYVAMQGLAADGGLFVPTEVSRGAPWKRV
jgi:shikimate kinase